MGHPLRTRNMLDDNETRAGFPDRQTNHDTNKIGNQEAFLLNINNKMTISTFFMTLYGNKV